MKEPFDAVFLGCRETRPREGSFSAQLLFEGTAAPAVCLGGGGLLTMEQSFGERVAGRTVTLCTFHGLRADRAYLFFVFTQGRIVGISYEQGRFQGFRDHSPSSSSSS